MQTLIKKQLFEGKFEIQGEIAKGQTGTVLYGYDIELRQEVAIKIYHSQINGRVIQGKDFIEKSKPLLRLDHPNLIKIFKLEEADGTPIVFMEFFDAPSLQQIIHDKGPMPVQDMLIRAREITEVLVHIHFQGIIHGTLHPGHVLVGPQGQIKVLDLGLSWILMDMLPNCNVELLRPLRYLPPEIAKEELLNVSSDLYCLGFMMYEMLTGTVPYAGLPKTSILGKLSFDQTDPTFDFPDSVPDAICDLICHMTRNNTQQRLQDATHVLTIINQQLPRLSLSKTHTSSESVASPPRAPAPEEPDTPQNPSTTPPQPSARTEPTLKKTPAFQRPQAYVNDNQGKDNSMLRKIGITLSLLVLIGVAGTLGYWYHDVIEPRFSNLQTQHEVPATSLSQDRPLKDTTSVTPDKNSAQSQKPLLKTNGILKDKPQSVPSKETLERSPKSNITPLSTKADQRLDKASSIQPPRSPKAKQGKALVPNKKQAKTTPALDSAPSQPVVSTSAGSTDASESPKALKNAPPQQPTSQPAKISKTRQGKPLAPTQNQPDATSQSVLGNSKPVVSTTASPTNTPQPPKALKNAPPRQPMAQSPTTSKTQPEKTLAPTQNPSDVTSHPIPGNSKPVISTTADPTNTPQPPKASTKVPRQQTTSLTPTKETIHPETEPAQSSILSNEIHNERTDEEMAELLQSVDAPVTDVFSLTEP